MLALAVAPRTTRLPPALPAHRIEMQGAVQGALPVTVRHPHLLHSLVVLPAFLLAIAAFLLGSIPTGYLLVRLFRHEDIRSVGSGNIGATNVLRSGGKGLGAATFLLDTLKGAAAVGLGALLASFLLPSMPFRDAQALAAVSAVVGHMFPVWLRFR